LLPPLTTIAQLPQKSKSFLYLSQKLNYLLSKFYNPLPYLVHFQNFFSLFTAYQILRSERKNRSYFLSAILKCRIEKQNCTLRGLRKENQQSI